MSMKFQSFKAVPTILVSFEEEGELHYAVHESQDAALLEVAARAAAESDCELPDNVRLAWVDGTVAFVSVENPADYVSGVFTGLGSLLELTCANDDGVPATIEMTTFQPYDVIQRISDGLNALIAT